MRMAPYFADVLFKKAKGCSGAPCTHQRSLRCILAQCTISARTTQICLLSQVDFQLPGHHSLRHADLADYLFDGVSHQHATQDLTSCVALHHPAPREAIGDWMTPATCGRSQTALRKAHQSKLCGVVCSLAAAELPHKKEEGRRQHRSRRLCEQHVCGLCGLERTMRRANTSHHSVHFITHQSFAFY